jgi:hypothetical protein
MDVFEVHDHLIFRVETGEYYRIALDPPPAEGPRHPAKGGTW